MFHLRLPEVTRETIMGCRVSIYGFAINFAFSDDAYAAVRKVDILYIEPNYLDLAKPLKKQQRNNNPKPVAPKRVI